MITLGPAALAAGAIAAAAALCGYWLGHRHTQARWDAEKLEQLQEDADEAFWRRSRAQDASTAFEAYRTAQAARLRQTHDALSIALRSPVSCPSAGDPPLELGDVLLPAGVLDRVRDFAAGPADVDRPSGEPGGALPGRATDPGR